LWQKTYGGSGGENATSIQQSLDGGYVVAGYTESFGTGNFDAWVLKLDSSGDIPGCDIIYTDELSLIDTTVSTDDVNLSITQPGTLTSNTIVTPKLLAAETSLVCCHSPEDFDSDGIGDMCDNCLAVPNPLQDDSYPPQGNGIGDVCDCEGNFNCFLDQDVDGSDAAAMKSHFGRSALQRPCIAEDPCKGDFNCDGDVDGSDASLFKQDFGRSSSNNPCPACMSGGWCFPCLPDGNESQCTYDYECCNGCCCTLHFSGHCELEDNCLGIGGGCRAY
jgi:hypothetical protein